RIVVEIVVPGQMQPAVDEVKRQFLGKAPPLPRRLGAGAIHADANLAGEVHVGIAGKGNDVGRGGIVQKIGVNLSQLTIRQEDQRQLAVGRSEVRLSVEQLETAAQLGLIHGEPTIRLCVYLQDSGHGSQAWVPAWERARQRRRACAYWRHPSGTA